MNSVPGLIESVSNSDRVLVVGVNWIGDALMGMPALQAWRRANPNTRLTMLVKASLEPLWRMHDVPNDVRIYDDSWASMRTAAKELRREQHTRAIIFPNSFRSALIPVMAGIPERIGRRGQLRTALLNRPLPSGSATRRHQSLEYYELLGAPPPPADEPEFARLVVPCDVHDTAERLMRSVRIPLLGVMPGAARGPAKRWPVAHFAAVAKKWVTETRGSVVVMGAGADASAGDAIVAEAGSGVNLAGKTSMVEWTACVSACDMVVCNDSGGMHLAAALRRPLVAIFGATDPRVTGPLGTNICVVQDDGEHDREIGHSDADAEKRLAAISPDRVYGEMIHLLSP
ncbi:MAG: lipopolysaccharide heptosyltransferase II [Kiritimatiellae bacterium]|nr:lipopolysaccharide heptosyltransferase II [Kiritimatiellia bacterium]